MFKSIFWKDPILKMFNLSLVILPTPLNINYMWNFGSMLGVCLMTQIISGLFLSMNYCPNILLAFNSIYMHINHNVNYGWLMRSIHMNGASIYFICMYMHMGRGIFYHSYNLTKTWCMGTIIFLLSMMTAFMGYVLPWGQMSYWGATVITNLISTIPFIGMMITQWIWGGYSVDNPTLNRFFSLHFILPFIIMATVMLHLMFLHETGSNNPIGTNSNLYKVPFHLYFTLKDILGFIIMLSILMIISLQYPFMLSDPDNFTPANQLNTPTHIQPEWYFLFAYAILRSIPNKFGGVLAMFMSIMILLILPFLTPSNFKTSLFYPNNKLYFMFFCFIMIMLTFIGSQPIEAPYLTMGKMSSLLYFFFFISNHKFNKNWDKIITLK